MKKLLFCLLTYSFGMPFFASTQPIRNTFLPGTGSVRIINDSLKKDYTNITLHWQVFANGLLHEEGLLPGLNLLPGRPRVLPLPLHTPLPPGETFARIEYRAAPPRNIAPHTLHKARLSSPLLSTQTLLITPWRGDSRIPPTGELRFSDSNNLFTVTSPTFRLSFDKESGWIQQYTVKDQPLLADSNGLRPALSSPPHLQLFSTSTGAQMVIVRTEYTVPGLSCLLHLSYTANAAGNLLIEGTLETDTTHPDSIPHPIDPFGMKWTLAAGADSLAAYTPTAGDSTPSIHVAPLSATPIVKNTRWCEIYDRTGKGFRLTADSNFLQIHIDVPHSIVEIYNHRTARPSTPVYFHYAFKVTPLTSIGVHPAAKPF